MRTVCAVKSQNQTQFIKNQTDSKGQIVLFFQLCSPPADLMVKALKAASFDVYQTDGFEGNPALFDWAT